MNYTNDYSALHTDLYQINMMYTYWKQGKFEQPSVFECYFRKMPFKSGYAIFAGLERIIEYLKDFSFSQEDIEYLRSLNEYDEEFLNYLSQMKLNLTVRSVVEGELVFNNEPLIQIEGPLGQAQLVETAILNIVNYQTLIATKAARIKQVCENDLLMEFGARRAQEMSAAIWGSRAAYIGGCDVTSNVEAGKRFGIPVSGTHAHSLVQAYRNEYEAFKAYAQTHKDCVFLVDTYDTMNSGVPNAIRVAKEMKDRINFKGVRIDSGDMAYISKQVRKKLDEEGFTEAKIYASNDLDEETILNLKMQHAKIDVWGVGTKLITAFDQPTLGAVYKLVAIKEEDGWHDTIKLSSNAEKMTTPGRKQVWRITSKENNRSEGDYITFIDEDPQSLDSLYMFHPVYTYINKTIENFSARPLLQNIFEEGQLIYHQPTLKEMRELASYNLNSLWGEYKRNLNPQDYPVDLSEKLWEHKRNLIEEIRHSIHKEVGKR